MGLFDMIKRLTRPSDDFLDENFDEPARAPFARRDTRSYADYAQAPQPGEETQSRGVMASAAAAVLGRQTERSSAAPAVQPMKLLVMRPERFEDAAGIADHMRQRHSIVLNLEATPKETSRRLVDFLSGVAYAMDGRIKRISTGTYIVLPANVDVMADDLEALSGSQF